MLEAVKKFVESCPDGGLCIIDRPTGSGKTYDAMRYIFENADQGKNIFYITPLNKNVKSAMEDCRAFFEKAGKAEYFDSIALNVKANADSVIDNWQEVGEEIPESISHMPSYYQLKGSIFNLKKIEEAKGKSIDTSLSDLYQAQLAKIREQDEPAFRKDIMSKVSAFGKTAAAKYASIKKQMPFLLKLYPAIESSHRKIFFLSVDKFFLGNTTIIEPGYKFIGNNITKNALIFIDEIDSTKETILRQEISESKEQKVDVVRLFSQINNSLKSKKIPANFFKQKDPKEPDHTSKIVLEKIKKVFAETSSKYNLDRMFKFEGKIEEDQSFLFDDFALMTISKGDKDKAVEVGEDEEKTLNTLSVRPSENVRGGGGSFYPVINSINGAITFFVNGITLIARNYMEWRNAIITDPTQDRMQMDSAISTILDCFDLDATFVNLLTRMILNHVHGVKNVDDKNVLSENVYDNGFRFYSFSDDIRQDLSTRINMVYLSSTPESFLASLADRSLVVGLSATGNIPTVTGNYDLDYLKEKLGSKFYVLDQECRQRLADQFAKKESSISRKSFPFSFPLVRNRTFRSRKNCCFLTLRKPKNFLRKLKQKLKITLISLVFSKSSSH